MRSDVVMIRVSHFKDDCLNHLYARTTDSLHGSPAWNELPVGSDSVSKTRRQNFKETSQTNEVVRPHKTFGGASRGESPVKTGRQPLR